MESFEPKKLALLRIWQILNNESDYDHPLTQEQIAQHLEHEYGIVMERKAISRNLSLLKEAGAEIASGRGGTYLVCRQFEDAELHMLIDGILSSRYITAKHSKDLIERLCGLSNRYFRASVKNVYSVNAWSKTDNQAVFYNIELIDSAIEQKRQLHYNYNKYGADKKMHKSSQQYVSPYQMLLHNQRYYLMAYSEYWHNMVFHRLDHITDMKVIDKAATPQDQVPGCENGLEYAALSSAMPYLFTDPPERVELIADAAIIDQIIDWFGKEIEIFKTDDANRVRISLRASPSAMQHWAMQYMEHVEVIAPRSLRQRICAVLEKGGEKYSGNQEKQRNIK